MLYLYVYSIDFLPNTCQQSASFGHIFTALSQEQLLRNFRSKIWPRHSLRWPRFPI